MAFWRTETMHERIPAEQLIEPYCKHQVTQSAYELCMGAEAFITSTAEKVKIELDDGKSLVIPPGQFALLLTEESIKVPLNAIAFISMRFGVKRRGLINVSGFHVDPGYEGRLKFSVYNAGSSPITITRGDRVFLIWFANLDGTTADGYGEAGPDQNRISSDDQNVMHGEIASPAELKAQIEEMRRDVDSKIKCLEHLGVNVKLVLTVCVTLVGAILVRLLFMNYFAVPSSTDIERLRTDVMTKLEQTISDFETRIDAPHKSKATEGSDTPDRQPAEQGEQSESIDRIDKSAEP